MKTILAYRFSAFGDVAMTVPVFREFLAQNPDAELIVMTRKNFQDLFCGIDRLSFHGISVEDYKGFLGMKHLADEILSHYRPHFIADLHDVIRTKILNRIFAFRGYKVYKIDKGKEEKERLTDVWNLDKFPLKKTTERYADVFREMGFPLILSHKLPQNNQEKKGFGFAPFAQHKGKMMPLEKSFDAVKLLARHDKIYLFGGGRNEIQLLNEWQEKIPNTQNLAGNLNLRQELDAISRLRVMISMDSANMHLASLMGTRCVSVWAQTNPFAGFLGYGQRYEDAVQVADLTCRPCSVFGDKECFRGDWACLEELSIQPLIAKVLS